MSVKVMGWVWDLEIPRDEKFILLAYADHADHDGHNVFPAIASVAKKTGYSERSVQRITRKIEERGLLIAKGINERYQTNQYYIPIPGGDKTSPPTDGGVTNETNGGDKLSKRGDIAVSPEPSLTVNKPSIKKRIAWNIPEDLATPEFREAWEEWQQHRKEIKKKMTPLAGKRTLNKLNKYSVGTAIRMLHYSIEQGYTGVFEVRGDMSIKKSTKQSLKDGGYNVRS